MAAAHATRAIADAGVLTYTVAQPTPLDRPQIRYARPERWGDVVMQRKDTPTSYHLSVVVDDAAQGITHVTRGRDMEPSTDIHVLLQILLGLRSPDLHLPQADPRRGGQEARQVEGVEDAGAICGPRAGRRRTCGGSWGSARGMACFLCACGSAAPAMRLAVSLQSPAASSEAAVARRVSHRVVRNGETRLATAAGIFGLCP